MAVILAVNTFASKTGLAKDNFVNNMCFLTTGAFDGTAKTALDTEIQDFYNTVDGTTSRAIASLLSSVIDRGSNKVLTEYYDVTTHLDGSDHGSPVSLQRWTLGATIGSTTSLPSELAICLSIHTAYGTDPEFGSGTRPRSRDRGRLYLGPWNDGGVAHDGTTNVSRPGVGYSDTIIAAALRLMGATTPSWAVWSRKNATAEPVVGGWCDDAWDIQRRRGEAPALKRTWGSTV